VKFLDFKSKFEKLLSEKIEIKLEDIEVYPFPYEGAVMIYLMNDRYIKLHYDTRDAWYYIYLLKNNVWDEQFFATPKQLLGSKLKKIVELVANPI
jgi:hypothetical protein